MTVTATRPITPAQSSTIRSMLAEVLDDTKRDAYRHLLNLARENGALDFGLASTVIDRLKAEDKVVSEAQINYLTDLLADREVDFDGEVARLSRKQASVLIDQAKRSPKRAQVNVDLPRHGYYAIVVDGETRFLRVATTGKVFRIAGPAEHQTSLQSAAKDLAAIKADPRAAAILYGQEIGRCGRCGTRLTDEQSRAQGLGPVCVTKGW